MSDNQHTLGTCEIVALLQEIAPQKATELTMERLGMLRTIAQLTSERNDLLAACEALCQAVEGHEQRTGVTQMHPAIDTARAAIAKARGE